MPVLPEEGQLLRIFIGESDRREGMPLYKWIVRKAREQGLAGATVLRGMAGFGAHSRLHTANILRLSLDLPIVVEIVDTVEKIEAFLPTIDEAISEGLVTQERVQIRFYRTARTRRAAVGVRYYLVVANQTLESEHLLATMREYATRGPCQFHIVVPVSPPYDQPTSTEQEAQMLTRERLEQALTHFRELGMEVTGELGDPRPMEAIRNVLNRGSFDEIIISTLPLGLSRWLRLDLPHRVERTFGLPVTHVSYSS